MMLFRTLQATLLVIERAPNAVQKALRTAECVPP